MRASNHGDIGDSDDTLERHKDELLVMLEMIPDARVIASVHQLVETLLRHRGWLLRHPPDFSHFSS